jgi:hypothetical protein
LLSAEVSQELEPLLGRLNWCRSPADAFGVEILQPVVWVLALIGLIWLRYWLSADQIKREQREQPFGSKRWHWPAAGFLGVAFLTLMLLRLVTDSG